MDSKRIARNTIFLYVRMLLLMAVSLYTSRVILKVLGIDDYGIYNLIAGFVTFLTFISNSLVSAMQRYFNFALGKKDKQYYKAIYSMSLNILFLFSLCILILGETVGLWFVKNYLNIPPERYTAAIVVYHISVITFIANTLRTPFHASIIAHEKMSFYAYVSIIEAVLRLGIVFLLLMIPFDHLIIYSILYLAVIILVNVAYMLYCRHFFDVCRYSFAPNKSLFKELLSFSSWSLLGQASIVVKNQGEAIFINKFFTVAANAAMGLASQVASALEVFVTNFQTAINPQLTQSYASKDYTGHISLLFKTSKYSFYLLLVLLIPIVFNIDYILHLWLEEVPQYTDYFIIFILISYLFNALSSPFYTSVSASGKIKQYQISVAGIFFVGLLLIYVILRSGAQPYSVSIVAIIIQICLLVSRVYYAHQHMRFSYKDYFRDVIKQILGVSLLALIFPMSMYILGQTNGSFLLVCLYLIYTGLVVLFVGMNGTERKKVLSILIEKR